MRQVLCGGSETSVLGFGCGSVLGRVGRAASLRAMQVAWEEGIRFFDTARTYGYGEAEYVLGEFLRGRREQAFVATKYGLTPQRLSAVKRVAVPMVRAALRVPGVRALTRRGGSGGAAVHGEFSVEGLRASVEESLRQLGTDRVDVLFLHEATTETMRQTEVMEELERLIRAGKVLRAGLYAGTEVIADGIAHGPATLGAMQFGSNLFDQAVAGFAGSNEKGRFLVANHPFRSEGYVAQVKVVLGEMAGDGAVPAELREKLRAPDWPGTLEALFGMILGGAGGQADALVLSMMQPEHLMANVRAVEICRFTDGELGQMRERMLRR